MNLLPSGDANGAKRTSWVLDASALLAALLNEPGAAVVMQAVVEGSVISAVNFSEVLTRMIRDGESIEKALDDVGEHDVTVIPHESSDAPLTALLREPTKQRGLSLGDRACLALAHRLGLPALTADRQWADLDVGVEIVVCR